MDILEQKVIVIFFEKCLTKKKKNVVLDFWI